MGGFVDTAKDAAKQAATKAINDNVPQAVPGGADFLRNIFNQQQPAQRNDRATLDAETIAHNKQLKDAEDATYYQQGTGGLSIPAWNRRQPVQRGDRGTLDAETAVSNQQLKDAQDAEDAAYYQQGTNGLPAPTWYENAGSAAKNAFSSGLKKLATPDGLSGVANIGAALLGRNEVAQGSKQAVSGYDQALAKVQDAQQMSGDAYNAVSDNPEQLAMRAQALKGLSDRASMGLTPEDQAALQGIQRQSANQFKAANATIGQDMARRGMANSGLSMAQSMGAADQAQQAQALAAQNQAAQSFAAKQAALNNLAGQSGAALQADYGRQLGKAQNLSAVNQFNTQQRTQANNAAANALVGKGQVQQDIATGKGKSTGQIGQAVAGMINPQAAVNPNKRTITFE